MSYRSLSPAPRLLQLLAALALTFFRLTAQNEEYALGPDSMPQPGVPQGTLTKQTFVAGPKSLFPGTVRDYWLYVPKQYSDTKPASLMVFQDGGGYVSTNGSWRVPTVFDNLIHKGEMPVTIGVFINPGVVPALAPAGALPRFNRSYEYDGLGDNYARFLSEELLPEVEARYSISRNPDSRAIAGASSGAIAAFTAAWERPDLFHRVFSTIGTYVGLRGGQNYPILVRKMEPKPLRLFLQDGYNDQNIYGGNWWIANQDMFSALQFAGYEVTNKWGNGGHDSKQGGSILPDAMRWLWRGHPTPINAGATSKQPLTQVLDLREDWVMISRGYRFPTGLAANEKGEVFFTDHPENKIFKVGLDGGVSLWRDNSNGAQSLVFSPDGRLIAGQNQNRQVAAFPNKSDEIALTSDAGSKELTVSARGDIYFTDPARNAVMLLDSKGRVTTLDTGLEFPNGICLTPDQSQLLVADTQGQFVWSYQIQTDGTLGYKQPYFHLHLPDDPRGSGADGMCVDQQGWLYVCTSLGLQMCDQAGRVNGIIAKPERAWLSDVCFGGKNLDELYVTCGDKIWRRKMKTKGLLPFKSPVMPSPPRL